MLHRKLAEARASASASGRTTTTTTNNSNTPTTKQQATGNNSNVTASVKPQSVECKPVRQRNKPKEKAQRENVHQ